MNFRHDISELSLPGRFARVNQLIDEGSAQGKSLFEMSGLFRRVVAMASVFVEKDSEFQTAWKDYENSFVKKDPKEHPDAKMWAVLQVIERLAARQWFWAYPDAKEWNVRKEFAPKPTSS